MAPGAARARANGQELPDDATLRQVSLDQLSYFVAVAEEGNIGRAARRLHISQPPLTRQIRQLEHELGVELFLRTPRGVQLLPAGQVLLPRARRVLEEVVAVKESVREVRGHADGAPPPIRAR
jgi:DNA-binding transcriptional LysR family regulator